MESPKIVFLGQSGPFAPAALRLLGTRGLGASLAMIIEGRRPREEGFRQRFFPPPQGYRADDGSNDLTRLAGALGIPCLQTNDVNHAETLAQVQRHTPDLLVCVGFDRLFSKELLDCAPWGGLNAHPSSLPQWRGPAPLFWALRTGDRVLTVTLHRLDDLEDHGPVLARGSRDLADLLSGAEIYRRAGVLAGELLADTVPQWMAGDIVETPQDHTRATRAPRPSPDNAFVDPHQWPCQRLANFVSAAGFFQTPWTRLGGEVFFFSGARGFSVGARLPAQYVLHGKRLTVQCADGIAELELQR